MGPGAGVVHASVNGGVAPHHAPLSPFIPTPTCTTTSATYDQRSCPCTMHAAVAISGGLRVPVSCGCVCMPHVAVVGGSRVSVSNLPVCPRLFAMQVFFPYILTAHQEQDTWPGHDFEEATDGNPKKSVERNTAIAAFMQSQASKTNAKNFEVRKRNARHMGGTCQPVQKHPHVLACAVCVCGSACACVALACPNNPTVDKPPDHFPISPFSALVHVDPFG